MARSEKSVAGVIAGATGLNLVNGARFAGRACEKLAAGGGED